MIYERILKSFKFIVLFIINLMNRSKPLYSPVLKLRESVSALDMLIALGNDVYDSGSVLMS